MRLFLNKLKNVLLISAVIASMICSICAVSASAVTGYNKAEVYSFSSDTEKVYSNPGGTAVSSGALSWKLYDNFESKADKNGLYIGEGYIRLSGNNPVNTFSDFKMEIVYSSSASDGEADGTKPFLVTSAKKYTLTQLMADSGTVLGIAENGDIYYKGQKINHTDGNKTADILSARNPQINPDDECKVTVKYINGKLTVTLTYNSGKTTVKLVENYSCGISGLQQFILGGDKNKRFDGMTYKSISVSEYGEYVPHTENGLKAVVQTGETVKEYTNADTALKDAISQSKNGNKPVIMFYSDMTLSSPINIENGKSLTVDLNGHS